MLFSDVPGHESLKLQLVKQVQEERISHARLFLGSEGCGALGLALAQAQYIHCENRGVQDSCGKCPSCQKHMKLIHPDLHFSYPYAGAEKDDLSDTYSSEWRKALLSNPFMGIEDWTRGLEAENRQLNIPIRECHSIYSKLSMKPFESEFQILIFWRPEYLGKEGNSLLKLIEEPSTQTLMIFVAENYEDILPTLTSRMQLFKVPSYNQAQTSSWMRSRLDIPEDRAETYAFLADGRLGYAISLSRGDVPDYHSLFEDWLDRAYRGRFRDINDWVEKMAKAGKDGPGREFRKNFLHFSLRMLREALLKPGLPAKAVFNGVKPGAAPHWTAGLNLESGARIAEILDKAIYHIERNANPRIVFLDVSLSLHQNLNLNTQVWS